MNSFKINQCRSGGIHLSNKLGTIILTEEQITDLKLDLSEIEYFNKAEYDSYYHV